MAEYGYNEAQDLQPGAAAILLDIEACNKCPQRVVHDNLTPNLTLRGVGGNCNCCNPKVKYGVSYTGNIAVAEGGAAGEIQVALSVNGYVRPFTISTATPAAAQEFWHAGGDTSIEVPVGLSANVALVNASVSADPATTPAPTITIRNLNIKVTRLA